MFVNSLLKNVVMKSSSLKKNFLMNILLTVSNLIYPLITFPYVSRILQPQGTGLVSFAITFVGYFVLISQLGIPTYGVRIVAQNRDSKEKLSRVIHELLFINTLMSFVAYISLVICIISIPKIRGEATLFLVVSSLIPLNCFGLEWVFRGLEQYTYIAIRSISFKAIALILLFIFVRVKSDYVIYGALSVFASSASYLLNIIQSRKYILFSWLGNYRIKRHLKAVLVFFAMSIATTIYTHLDVLMLGFMKTDIDVGYYDAAVKIKMVLVAIVTSLGAVLLPRSSAYIKQNRIKDFYALTDKAMRFVVFLATPLFVYFLFYSKQCILLLSGEAYEGAIAPMRIIMPTVLLIGITNIMGIQILVPLGKEKYVLHSEIAGAISDFILNLILIPHYAVIGAAIATLFAETIVLFVQYYYLSKMGIHALHISEYWRTILAVIISSLSSIWVIRLSLNNVVSLVISACLFFTVYILIMVMMKDPVILENKGVISRLFIADK